jgi:hypothetical protein
MNVLKMIPRHSLCRQELLIRFFYLTSDKQLLLRGYCAKCRIEDIDLYLPLSEMMDDCPDPPMRFTVRDIAELAGMNILLDPPANLPEATQSPPQ